jgi:hypothetical protein
MKDLAAAITLTPEMTQERGESVSIRLPMPSLHGQPARMLLEAAIGIAVALRYVREDRSPECDVVLMGEIPRAAGAALLDPRSVDAWLARQAGTHSEEEFPPEDVLADAMDQTGLACVRRDALWAVPASPGLPRELLIQPRAGGVTVEGTLTTWESISSECADALAEFLVAAQAGLRWARCELRSHSAHVVCQTRSEHLGVYLVHAVHGVASAARMLAREASALLVPELAYIYLEAMTRPAKRPAGDRPGR